MIRFPRSGGRIALVALMLIVAGGCASLDTARIPPVDTAGTEPIPGKIVWHDLLTEDPAAARRFYAELFGWSFRDVGLGRGQTYTVIEHEGRVIGGLVDARGISREANVSQWVPVLSIAEMDAAMAALDAAGGKVFQAPVEIPQRGRLAVVADPQGALLTLLEPREGDPPDRPARPGDWLWSEIWSSDPEATLAFYQSLVSAYRVERVAENSEYRFLSAGGIPRVGVVRKPVERIADTWMAYVNVADPAATVAAAERLGGEILLPVRDDPRGGEVAILNDPAGAGFLVQSWEPATEQEAKR